MTPDSVSALILAAGSSERMGDFKPLMTLGGTTLLERVVGLFRSIGVRQVRVVVGHRASDIMPVVERCGACPVLNADYRSGMYSSVKAGMIGWDESTACVFVLPVDIPLVRPATLRAVLSACPQGASAICYPTFGGRRGHPPLIGRAHVPAVLGYSGERGLAGLLNLLRSHAVEVPVVDQFIHADMDSPEDYRRLSEWAGNRECFTSDECRELLERLHVPVSIAAHGRAVADIALRIGSALNTAGGSLDLPLIGAAALVHDIARHENDHAARGGELLRRMGMPRMAEIVEAHMDLPPRERMGEAEVVFLADKLVRADRFVGLNARFERRLQETAADSPDAAAVHARLECARRLSDRVATMIGHPVERLFPS